MSTQRTFVNNSIPPRFLRYVRQQGGDAEALVRRFGFPDDTEQRADLRTRMEVLVEFAHACAETLKDPMLGLHVAQSVGVGSYGLLEFVLRATPTMRDALEQMVRYMALVEDAITPRVAQVREDAVFEFGVPRQDHGLGRPINEYILCVIMRVGRMMMKAPWPVKRVWFSHAAPLDVAPLQAFFETTELEFNARSNGLRFDAALLARPMPTADAALHAFLQQQVEDKMGDDVAGPSLVDRVRQLLSQGMGSGNIQIERVATALHCSGRTLQRRLTQEGTSFQDVLDDVRHEQALILLQTSKRGVSEVAFLLGYSDLGPFVRAFKRWTGKTPTDLRATV